MDSAERFLLSRCDKGLLPATRIHLFSENIWIKREDEAGFSIAGGKKRKFASLLPWLKSQGFNSLILTGSEASNNVLAGAQLCREYGLQPYALLKKSHSPQPLPNAFFSGMLFEAEDCRYLSAQEWKTAERFAAAWMTELSSKGKRPYLLPEGGFCEPCLPGAMNLALDILRNERESHIVFQNVYVDAGSGLTAAALMLGLEYLGSPKNIFVCLAAGSQDDFLRRTEQVKQWAQKFPGSRTSQMQPVILNPEGGTFQGRLTESVRNFILETARTNGLFLDPFYNAGLFRYALGHIASQSPEGNSLIILSGGGMSLLGYQDKLAQKP